MFSVNLKIASLGQRRFYSTTAKPLLGKFNETPLVLYRIQSGAKASLRDYETQKAKGRTSFDLVLKDNLVIPYKGENFVRPNGMSARPGGPVLGEIIANFRGAHRIIEIPSGIKLPSGLILFHEHSDHYSFQTTEPISLDALNKLLTKFLAPFPTLTKEQYFQKHPMA